MHSISNTLVYNEAYNSSMYFVKAYGDNTCPVLFSILMTENKNRALAWGMMILLTALQVTANVYASFKFMDVSGTTDWTYWQRAILFGVNADSPEMYKVIIAWISGALLPLVALGMTALVADQIKLAGETGEKRSPEKEEDKEEEKEESAPLFKNPFKRFKNIKDKSHEIDFKEDDEQDESFVNLYDLQDKVIENIKEESENPPFELIEDNLFDSEKILEATTKTAEVENKKESLIEPVNKTRGWNLMNEYVDDDFHVFQKGAFIKKDLEKTPTSKKA